MRWKPKLNQKFWYVSAGDHKTSVCWSKWDASTNIERYYFWQDGNCFRTQKEALSAKRAILKVLGGV